MGGELPLDARKFDIARDVVYDRAAVNARLWAFQKGWRTVGEPPPSEEYITVVDNKGRERVQRVEYVVLDVRGEKVYVTADELAYTEDSLQAKDLQYFIGELDKIPIILSHPDIVIHDHTSPEDTLIYYRRIRLASLGIHQLVAVVIKIRQGIKFFYNMHPQKSGRVKGYRERIPPQVWYIAPGKRRREFGLRPE